ncbi:hypothetical protein KIN20_023378 [Parelaphostrongylus tenuis]|uniref:Uncharacterized protein n=1 Tax=Parelaphostrongylus tenuis TaxID=148309 RepID=A0AAD5MRJ0_PARTN|nr:hypothetical protein KIN20_023378 [Parelaphostrongylus tenuis]
MCPMLTCNSINRLQSYPRRVIERSEFHERHLEGVVRSSMARLLRVRSSFPRILTILSGSACCRGSHVGLTDSFHRSLVDPSLLRCRSTKET